MVCKNYYLTFFLPALIDNSDQSFAQQKTERSNADSSSEGEDGEPVPNSRPLIRPRGLLKENSFESIKQKKARAIKRDESSKAGDMIRASEAKTSSFNCNMHEIKFSLVGNGEVQGYAVRLELSDIDDEEAERQFLIAKNI